MGYISLCRGDLFAGNPKAIAQGCNLKGSMGKGIAELFKEKFPEMFDEYHKLCEEKKFEGGAVYAYVGEMNKKPVKVYNLMTQEGFNGASIEYLHRATEAMCASAEQDGIDEITMPLIGGGLGRITPSTCLNIFSACSSRHKVRLNVIVQVAEGVVPKPIIAMQPDHERPYPVKPENQQPAHGKILQEALAQQMALEANVPSDRSKKS